MNDWSRNRNHGYNYDYQGGGGGGQRAPMRHQNRRPPSGNWQPTVPAWEKRFICKECRIPWGRFLEGQKMMYMYNNVLQWDDSAGKEAFYNGKARFWAELNNHPCDISLPDPEMYSDEVDWDAEIDPELLLDLEREPEVCEEHEMDQKPGLAADTLYLMNQPVECTGWGDVEDVAVRKDNNPCDNHPCDNHPSIKDNPGESGGRDCDMYDNKTNNAWGQRYDEQKVNPWKQGIFEGKDHLERNPWQSGAQGCDKNDNNKNNPWEQGNFDEKQHLVPNAWGDHSSSWGPWENQFNLPGDNIVSSHWDNNVNEWESPNSRRSWNDNWRKRESDGQYLSRYKTTRHQGFDHHMDHGWRNGGGRKRGSFVQENNRWVDKKPIATRQWNPIRSCGPTSHHKAEDSWGWERRLS